MKKFVVLLFLCVFSFSIVGCASKSEKELKRASKNINEYNMEIKLEGNQLSVVQTTKYINKSDDVLNQLCMHVYPRSFREDAKNSPVGRLYVDKAYPNGRSYCDFVVSSLVVENEEKQVYFGGEDEDILEISLNKGLYPDDDILIKIKYSMTLPNINHRFGYGDSTYNIANFYPIMCVYENGWCKESYNSNGDPFYSDLANYNVEFIANKNMKMATSGDFVSIKSNNNTNTYKVKARAIRDYACVLSDKFEVIESKAGDVKIKYYYYDDINAEDNLQTGVDAINTFSRLFGQYPYSTFSIVKTNFIHGGMEYPNLVYISDAVSDLADYKNVIIHETAHQWWYGLVGSNAFRHGWLDEGLTDFSTALFYKHNPDYNVKFDDIIKNTTNSYVTFVDLYTKVLGSVNTDMKRAVDEFDTEPEYVYVSYVKGALLYNTIYETFGEEKFLKIMKRYLSEYKYQNVKPEHFVGIVEKVTMKDMESFFSSWIEGNVEIKAIA